MSKKYGDFTGKIFKNLTVKSFSHQGKWGQYFWNCECSYCGETVKISTASLNKGAIGCKKLKAKILADNNRKRRIEDNSVKKRNTYTIYKIGAEKRGIEFSLNFEQFIELSQKNCFYCGKEPSQIIRCQYPTDDEESNMRRSYIRNGIDRADNLKGYILDNCVPCCKNCNFMKLELSQNDFLSHIERIHKYQKDKKNDLH